MSEGARGMVSETVKLNTIKWDEARHGVWVGDLAFLPRNVVVRAFQEVMMHEQDGGCDD